MRAKCLSFLGAAANKSISIGRNECGKGDRIPSSSTSTPVYFTALSETCGKLVDTCWR